MKKNEKTKVQFLIEKNFDFENHVFAWFPNGIHNEFTSPNGTKVTSYICYSQIGQHSVCNIEYTSTCKEATPEQYSDLEKELEGIGYNLLIVNS